MAVPIFIRYVFPTGIQDSEFSPEIPEGIADAGMGKNVEDIAEPGQKAQVKACLPEEPEPADKG